MFVHGQRIFDPPSEHLPYVVSPSESKIFIDLQVDRAKCASRLDKMSFLFLFFLGKGLENSDLFTLLKNETKQI